MTWDSTALQYIIPWQSTDEKLSAPLFFSSLNTALHSISEFMFKQRHLIIPGMVRHFYKSDRLKRVHLKSRSSGSVCLMLLLWTWREEECYAFQGYFKILFNQQASCSSVKLFWKNDRVYFIIKPGVIRWSSYQLFLSCGYVQAWSQFCTRQAANIKKH